MSTLVHLSCRRPAVLSTLALAGVWSGCGNDIDSGRQERAAAIQVAQATARPALLATPRRPGEVVLRGSASPRRHGPMTLEGRYVVRFEQYAPEDPTLDIAAQTSFVVDLKRTASHVSHRLFRVAAATGRTTVTAHGRYYVDVTFGDLPYVLRLTPASR